MWMAQPILVHEVEAGISKGFQHFGKHQDGNGLGTKPLTWLYLVRSSPDSFSI